ncbi:hypothetical protein L226DRAFT_584382 [Lentinus tigrinus ALCF2SS1-7]|uniref:Uncharacterized protein n=1 Tax=Lentinus tigrinus ALCF2SS1-6 TaxID=1328759 RepID=A0A5C2RLK7_9APHY|nr:hypothetical protein L227DRAFT_628933 [Lentinus tigrinus ALCF2SS1-6]RPD67603.1 hypothetical protein L226DRAFT_584382 [Lentinus tigrinus ALCF2SS1-7]
MRVRQEGEVCEEKDEGRGESASRASKGRVKIVRNGRASEKSTWGEHMMGERKERAQGESVRREREERARGESARGARGESVRRADKQSGDSGKGLGERQGRGYRRGEATSSESVPAHQSSEVTWDLQGRLCGTSAFLHGADSATSHCSVPSEEHIGIIKHNLGVLSPPVHLWRSTDRSVAMQKVSRVSRASGALGGNSRDFPFS